MKRLTMRLLLSSTAVAALALGCSDNDPGNLQPGGTGGSASGSGGMVTVPGSGSGGTTTVPTPVPGTGGASGVLPPDNGQCVNIARPSKAPLPHVTASGAKATAIVQALSAIYAAQTPPVTPASSHVVSDIVCYDTQCELNVQVGATAVDIKIEQPRLLVINLFNALTAAGAKECGGGPKSNASSVKAAGMTVSPNEVQFDDTSTYSHGWTPNVMVTGSAAAGLLSAWAAAGIKDCNPSSSVFMLCTNFGGHPTCGYQRRPYERVGDNYFLNGCIGGGAMQPGDELGNDQSFKMWQALLVAAQDSGFKPDEGKLEQTTIINAHFFTYDGAAVRFFLTTGNATPPPNQ